jgi:hypothetical protein
MAQASRDDNFVTTLLAVSSVDGVTPVTLYANPTTHRLLVDLAGGGSGTVQTISIATANGFAGTSNGNASAPTLTLTTTINGILKGNGTAISAITVGSGLSYDGTTLSATSGGGNVSNTGTPVNNQVAIWTDATTIEGDSAFTFDTATDALSITTSGVFTTGTIELGAATDTTISRAGAGQIAVEGVNVLMNGGALGTPSSGTVTNLTGTASININGTVGATTPTTATFTTATINTGLVPDTNDGAYLGLAATAFSDLFLASGAVIGFANGDMTVTHSSGMLTIGNTATGAVGPILELYQDSSSPAANDDVAELRFSGEDSAGNKQVYGNIYVRVDDATSATEDAKFVFSNVLAGAQTSFLDVSPAGLRPRTNDQMSLGAGTLAYSDLFLASGGVINWDNSDVNITHSTNALTFAGGVFRFGSDVYPDVNNGAALGSAALQWGDLFLAEGGVINWDNGDATLTQVGNDVTLAGASLTARVKPRTGTVASSATPTINTDDVDFYSITAQTVDITSFTTNLSGTPTDGQKLWIAITGTAARAITWGASFEASTVALPTTTVTTNRLDVGFVWNVATSKWRCIAAA